MAPKRASNESLRNVATADEIESARELLAGLDPKAKRSKMQCMVSWLKQNPGDENEEALGSRGSDRERYLCAYIAYMKKKKSGTAKINTSVSRTNSFKTSSDYVWMSKHEMDLKLGAVKAEHWRASGKLEKRADPVSHSMEEDLVEYKVYNDWGRSEEGGGCKISYDSAADGDEQDLKNILGMSSSSGVRSTPTTPAPAIKKEPKTEKQLEDEKVEQLLADPCVHIKRFSSHVVDVESLLPKTLGHKYTAELHNDCQKAIVEMNKVIGSLKEIVKINA